jgi:hypothetical protein
MSQSSKSSITMTRGELLRLKEAAGQVIRVQDGRLWITQENEGIDHVLEPGEVFTVRAGGLTLVGALRASALDVTMQHAAAPLVFAGAR